MSCKCNFHEIGSFSPGLAPLLAEDEEAEAEAEAVAVVGDDKIDRHELELNYFSECGAVPAEAAVAAVAPLDCRDINFL